MEYYSAIKKNEIMSSAALMGGPGECHISEVSQTEKKLSYDIPYIQNLKRNYIIECIYNTEADS